MKKTDINPILLNINIYKANLIREDVLKKSFPIYPLIKQIIKSIFFSHRINIKHKSNILLVKSFDRKDINNDYENILNSLQTEPSSLTIHDKYFFNFSLEPIKNVIFKKKIFHKINYYTENKNITFFGKLILYFSYIEAYKLLSLLINDKNFNVKKVICMMEMQFVENIIIQYFNFKQIKTYAWSHALYRFTGYTITKNNPNPVNYLASAAKYALVWGEIQAKFVYEHSNQIPLIIGKNIHLSNSFEVRKNLIGQKYKYLIILESVKRFNENQKLVKKMLKMSDSCAFIKHPDDNKKYAGNINLVNHDEVNYDYVVGIDTSAIIEYGIIKSNIFLTKNSKFFELIEKIEEKFKFDEDIINELIYIPYNNVGKKLWPFFIGGSFEKYRDKINKLF